MKKILVIEDDGPLQANLAELLEAEGFEVVVADDGVTGVHAAVVHHPDLVICDIMMPELDGYGVLAALQKHPDLKSVPFMYLSARTSLAEIRHGMNLGADDYVTKPFTRVDLLSAIHARFRRRQMSEMGPVSTPTAGPASASAPFFDLTNPVMQKAYDHAFMAARSDINVLVLGETGVGKDVLANEIHRRSQRASGPMVALNCSALPETLLESELFGYEKGAFTGALTSRAGLFEAADGGTVFLDELGDMPMSVQVKLLRVLEERKVTRVGGRTALPIDVRFVAATNKDLERAAAEGRFRRDLLFRINTMEIALPPLRERRREIVPLAKLFLANACRTLADGRALTLSDEAAAALERYEWPGNVRELRNCMDRAAVLCRDEATVGLKHLPDGIARATTGATVRKASDPPPLDERSALLDPLARKREEIRALQERQTREALELCGNNQTRAAVLLGISRRTIVQRVNDFDLPRPRGRGKASRDARDE